MNADAKKQLPELAKIGAAILLGVGVVGTITYLVLPPKPPLTITLAWDTRGNDAGTFYEVWSTVNLASNKSWYLKGRVNTNRMTVAATNRKEFFAVRAAVAINVFNGVTNWMVSDWSSKR